MHVVPYSEELVGTSELHPVSCFDVGVVESATSLVFFYSFNASMIGLYVASNRCGLRGSPGTRSRRSGHVRNEARRTNTPFFVHDNGYR